MSQQALSGEERRATKASRKQLAETLWPLPPPSVKRVQARHQGLRGLDLPIKCRTQSWRSHWVSPAGLLPPAPATPQERQSQAGEAGNAGWMLGGHLSSTSPQLQLPNLYR